MPNRVIRRRTFLTGAAALAFAAGANAAAQKMKLAIGCDHAGFPLKGPVLELLHSWGYSVKDCGTFSTDPVDFPDIAQKVTGAVLSAQAERAIMVCGSGIGACTRPRRPSACTTSPSSPFPGTWTRSSRPTFLRITNPAWFWRL